MKKTNKALIMSVFLFPGAGHIVLKRTISSIILMGIALSAMATIMHFVVKQAQLIIDKILQGELEPNIFAIRKLMAEHQVINGSLVLNIAIYVLIAVWLIGILDCYRIIKESSNTE